MRARLWPAVAVSFGALLFLLTLFAWLVSREAAQIHEHTKTARQIYKRADDAISDIQANINKGALIEQSGFSTLDVVESKKRIADLQRSTAEDCTTLAEVIGASQEPEILALQQGLDQYWSSIQQSLGTPRTQHGEQRLFRELENQPEKVLDLAGRIDSLNQASLAHEEQEIEVQQTKLREVRDRCDVDAAAVGVCRLRYSVRHIWLDSTKSPRQRGSAPRRRNKNSGVYPTSWYEYRKKKEKRSRGNFMTKWASY